MSHEWIEKLPVAITVCDREGTILSMNERSCETFAADGGAALVGTNVLDCHPSPSREKLAGMLESGAENIYTIRTKAGVRKMIAQVPWFDGGGSVAGFVELAFSLPVTLPHFDR